MTHEHEHKHISALKPGMKIEFMLGSTGRTAIGTIVQSIKSPTSQQRKHPHHFLVQTPVPQPALELEQHHEQHPPVADLEQHEISQENVIRIIE
jgi:hypothetical protein